MDTWQAAQSWLLFSGVAGCLGAYYYYSQHGGASAPRLDRRRLEQEARGRTERAERDLKPASKKGTDATKKRKAPKPETAQTQPTPEVVVQQDVREEKEDMSNRHFAEQMSKARKGADLNAPKNKENRVKTVKQGSAMNTPAISSGSSQTGGDADDDMSPAGSPALPAGDVSDMLEPATKGPTTLRLTAPAQPQKPKVAKQTKQQEVETKKQRQNKEKKAEQQRQREVEERERKVLENNQRKYAREARGEPAKNGISVSKPPANNAWTAPKAQGEAPTTNGHTNGPLLDTFDAESTASSNGGPEPSTAATSTTEAEATDRDHDKLSEEEQMAMAVKQSEDESGWTTAAPKKKLSKKKPTNDEATGTSTPVEGAPAVKAAPAVSKPTINGMPNGFLALNDHGDASDPSSWDPRCRQLDLATDGFHKVRGTAQSAQRTPSSQHHFSMAQIRGTAGYHLGNQNNNNFGGMGNMGGPQRQDATNDPSPLAAIRAQTSKIEDWLDTISDPLKPYLPAIGRFLIVVTFLEDALRIMTQWNDQLVYLHDYRHIPRGITHLFLILNVCAMTTSSLLIIIRKYSEYAVMGLIAVVVTQALGYGLIFDLNFFLRNLSVMGGLLMVLSDSWVRKKFAPAGLPQLDEKDRKMYFQLAGRVLLIFLFAGFVFAGEWSAGRLVVIAIGFVACVMVVVGFKAKWSAIILVMILSVFNIIVNNFWTLHPHHPHKDFAKYDFFQILSIVGGLLLLVNMGPGQFSVDEKKKVY
ncbi:ER-derived vesicles protein erv29 [Elasticomyces elasticus]|nr:ER-derived vesicles protein erv29 [Elasticomyces elasticus]